MTAEAPPNREQGPPDVSPTDVSFLEPPSCNSLRRMAVNKYSYPHRANCTWATIACGWKPNGLLTIYEYLAPTPVDYRGNPPLADTESLHASSVTKMAAHDEHERECDDSSHRSIPPLEDEEQEIDCKEAADRSTPLFEGPP